MSKFQNWAMILTRKNKIHIWSSLQKFQILQNAQNCQLHAIAVVPKRMRRNYAELAQRISHVPFLYGQRFFYLHPTLAPWKSEHFQVSFIWEKFVLIILNN